MIQTTPQWTPMILSRFHNFDDALVRGVTLVVGASRGQGKVTVTLEARDAESEGDEAWARVLMKVAGVTEYRFVENETEWFYVLSLGLKIKEFDGIHFFDLGGDLDEPATPEHFRASRFYLAGREYTWEIKPYPKSWLRRGPVGRAPRG